MILPKELRIDPKKVFGCESGSMYWKTGDTTVMTLRIHLEPDF